MAHGRPGPLVGFAALENHDGLGGAPANLGEAPSLGDGFQVQAHGLGLRIGDQVLQKLGLVHIHLVADGADLGHAHGPVAHGVYQKPAGEHPRLDHQGDVPGDEPLLPDQGGDKGEDTPVAGIDQTHAVGAPKTDAGLGGQGLELLLEGLSFRAALGKPPGLDHNPLDAPFRAIPDGPGNQAGRDKGDGQVHRIGYLGDGTVAGQPLDLLVSGVDRIDVAFEPGDQILQDRVSALELVLGRPDDGYSLRFEKELHKLSPGPDDPADISRNGRGPGRYPDPAFARGSIRLMGTGVPYFRPRPFLYSPCQLSQNRA